MPEQPSFGSLDRPRPDMTKPGPETSFRIALLADFGGRSGRPAAAGAAPLAERRPVRVRHDALDGVLAKMRPGLRLSAGGERVELAFTSLDDFHPDQIFDQFEPFAELGEDEQNDLMRAVLHHRDFQALESAWRGLEWLLRRADRGGRVDVVLYDVTRDELAADLTASEDLARSGLYQLLVEKAVLGPKGERWGLLVGDSQFDRTTADVRLLGRLAKVAAHAGAPFLSGAAPAVHASAAMPTAAAPAWDALRRLPEAGLLGLALPRFLLRTPYGPDTSSIDRFEFDEFARAGARKPYLWGNAALAAAALLAHGFQKQGWGFTTAGLLLDLPDMPMHVARDEYGDPTAVLAEAWLDRRVTEPLGKQGFMCLLGVRGRDAVELVRFQSLAAPPKDRPFADLWGPWGQEGVGPPVGGAPPVAVQVGFGVPRPAAAAPAPAPPAAPAAPPAATPAPAEDAELAALLQDLAAPAAAAPPAAAAAPAPADDVDQELAALLNEIEAPAESAAAANAPPPGPPGAPAVDAAADEADQELAALLEQLGAEGG
jgi:type VI secretion system protein ImpC